MKTLVILIIVNLVLFVIAIVLLKKVFAKPKYTVNYYTKEIHRNDTKDTRCQINNMTNCSKINEFEMKRLLKKGYNGCYHCNRELDTDITKNKGGSKQ